MQELMMLSVSYWTPSRPWRSLASALIQPARRLRICANGLVCTAASMPGPACSLSLHCYLCFLAVVGMSKYAIAAGRKVPMLVSVAVYLISSLDCVCLCLIG